VVYIFAERSQKDGPKDGEAVLKNSWMRVFGGCFEKGCGSIKDDFYSFYSFYFYP